MSVLYCRFCAEQKSTDQINDLSQWSFRHEIVDKLSIFSNVWVDFGLKDLPETICNVCFTSLSAAYVFFYNVIKSQIILQDVFSGLKQEEDIECTENAAVLSIPETSVKDEELEIDEEIKDLCGESIHFNDTPTKLEEVDDFCDDFIDYNDSSTKLEEVEDSCVNSIDFNDTPIPANNENSWSNYKHFVCKHCDGQFDSILLLREHCKDEHGVCNGLKCSLCHQEFKHCDTFFAHMRVHCENLRSFCPYCYINIVNIDHPRHYHYCQHCGEDFPDRTSVVQHLKTYTNSVKIRGLRVEDLAGVVSDKTIDTWNDYCWICRYCGVEEGTSDLLKQHTKQVHGKCFGLKCIDCSETIASFPTFVDHVVSHRTNLKKYCAYCNYKFEHDREQHIAQHQSELQCKFCVEPFEDVFKLVDHLYIYARYNKKKFTEEDLTCNICNKVSKCFSAFRSHVKCHTERPKDYSCDRCGMTFYTEKTLRGHAPLHNSEAHLCKICKKTYKTRAQLRNHVVTHNTDRPFKCTHCQKKFRLKKHLTIHAKIHTDDMPYSCQYCTKRFKLHNNLKVHARQHTGVKTYSCELCNKEFFNWPNFNKHMERKHGTTLAKTKVTAEGRVQLNPKSLEQMKLNVENTKEWKEKILSPQCPGRKTAKSSLNTDYSETDMNVVCNVGKKLSAEISPSSIRDVNRVLTKMGKKPTSIVAEFSTVVIKNDLLALAKTYNKDRGTEDKLNTVDVGIRPKTPIYVAEYLAPSKKKLFSMARQFASLHKFKFCWTVNGKIYLRKENESQLFCISTEECLNKIPVS